ncbi:TPA: hypothetical protein ACIYLO_005115, partial [Escherichia coli]
CRVSQPADYKSAQPRQRFFCAYCIATSFSRQNYGGAYGADFGRAGISCSRYCEPRTSRHPQFRSSGW